MSKRITSLLLGLFMVMVMYAPVARAQTNDLETLRSLIQTLIERIQELRNQQSQIVQDIKDAQSELKEYVRDGLQQGMSHEDIREIQELLATDQTIYPEGFATGYFGPLTQAALKRFQTKYELEVSGEIDEETRAALNTILEERFGEGKVPPGLLHAPGIMKKFERRLELGCDNSGPGKAPFCVKIKEKYNLDDDDDGSDDDDSEDDEDGDGDEDEDEDDDDDDDSDDDNS